MNNLENSILLNLIFHLSDHTEVFPDAGSIDISTSDWLDSYDGMGTYRNGSFNIESKYFTTLSLARQHFHSYNFTLDFYNPSIDKNIVKAYLKYIKKEPTQSQSR
jgi:hypothetical protein